MDDPFDEFYQTVHRHDSQWTTITHVIITPDKSMQTHASALNALLSTPTYRTARARGAVKCVVCFSAGDYALVKFTLQCRPEKHVTLVKAMCIDAGVVLGGRMNRAFYEVSLDDYLQKGHEYAVAL